MVLVVSRYKPRVNLSYVEEDFRLLFEGNLDQLVFRLRILYSQMLLVEVVLSLADGGRPVVVHIV